MLTHVAEERAVGDVTVAAQGDPPGPAALDLSHRIGCADEAVVYLDGELDIASAERAVSYVREVIDHRRGPVIVNLAALAFCDAAAWLPWCAWPVTRNRATARFK